MRTLALLFFLFTSLLNAQQKLNLNKLQIDGYMEEQMSKWNVPGTAIAIVQGDKLVYAKGYGYRNVEDKLPVTPHTVFKIASLTKSFTAATAGLLVDQKLLEWDKPVKEYLPELDFADKEVTRQVTLTDLLTHRTGLYDDDWSWVGDHIDRKRLFEILAAMPQERPLRTGFIYSNMTYSLVGALLESRTGESWRNLIRKKFLEPLGMSGTCFSHNENSGLIDFAYGYDYIDSSKSFSRGNLSEHFTDSLSVCEPFAFISASATDLSKWVRLFINGGKWQGKQLIPAQVFRILVKPVNYVHASRHAELSDYYYAMGWEQNYYKGHQLLQHSGGLMGFKTYMSYMPGDSIGIVVLTNGQPYSFPMNVTYDLYDILMEMPRSLWSEKSLARKTNTNRGSPEKAVVIEGTQPSKPLPAYSGTYFSKWLGKMKVNYRDGDLYFQFHNYPEEKMKHAHYNTFFTEAARTPGNGITFQLDHDGKVKSMLLNDFMFEKISEN